MNKLQTELQRLYLPTGTAVPTDGEGVLPLVGADGRVRAWVLTLARPADWRSLSVAWQGVQADWGWPEPAIAVNGHDGYQLWFSLATPVAQDDAHQAAELLRERFLTPVSPHRVVVHGATVPAVPWQQPATGHWSAFVAPDLAPVFADDPWLDLRPSDEAQAEVLSRLRSIKASEFLAVLASAPVTEPADEDSTSTAMSPATPSHKPLHPRQFLQSVMDDPAVALPLRIDAAKALLAWEQAARPPAG